MELHQKNGNSPAEIDCRSLFPALGTKFMSALQQSLSKKASLSSYSKVFCWTNIAPTAFEHAQARMRSMLFFVVWDRIAEERQETYQRRSADAWTDSLRSNLE